jgi:hypothetical protein
MLRVSKKGYGGGKSGRVQPWHGTPTRVFELRLLQSNLLHGP